MNPLPGLSHLAVPGSVKLTTIRDTKLQGQIHPFSVRSVAWLVNSSHNPKDLPNNLPLVVLGAGSLFLVDRSDVGVSAAISTFSFGFTSNPLPI